MMSNLLDRSFKGRRYHRLPSHSSRWRSFRFEQLEDRKLLTAIPNDIVSEGPSADVIKSLDVVGRGERLGPEATTDVWALDQYAYMGTFQEPCGDGTGENGSGVQVFDVHNPQKVTQVGSIPSVVGSRVNDIKVAHMNSGTILVHSNEACAANGVGGFEIWNVEDPLNPQHLSHVQTDDINGFLREIGFVDHGVHNLFLFQQGEKDYVAAVVESEFGNFQVFEITDPTNPQLVGFWGPEELRMTELGLDPDSVPDLGSDEFETILDLDGYLFSGHGSLAFRLLHDITVSDDGTRAYLSSWDAGLVLLDISDPTDPAVISVADATAGPGGEGNSHAAWPTADGSTVVETTEDFDAFKQAITIDSGDLAGTVLGGSEDAEGAPPPRFSDTGPVSGELVYVGQLCDGDAVENAAAFDPGDIAVIRRGGCLFFEKLLEAQDLGASAVIIANNVPGPFNWIADDPESDVENDITIPALFVTVEAGDILEAHPTGNTATIDPEVFTELSPWGFVRIWDYTDPTNPVLASTFNTVNSLNESGPPDARGAYSVHNVIVEGDRAYISWYSEGVMILDISDPYHPVEIARYHGEGADFELQNGGIQNVWGISKVPDIPWIYASDRNGGLYVLKEKGGGLMHNPNLAAAVDEAWNADEDVAAPRAADTTTTTVETQPRKLERHTTPAAGHDTSAFDLYFKSLRDDEEGSGRKRATEVADMLLVW